MSTDEAISLQALLLADHIYRDQVSGKYVIAGTFHQVNVASFPAMLGRSVGVFIALNAASGRRTVELEFVDAENGEVLAGTGPLGITCPNGGGPVEFAVEVPPLPLPHGGRYLMRLAVEGRVLGEAPVTARSAPAGA